MRKIECESCPKRGLVCDLPSDALADFRAAGATSIYRAQQVVFSEGNAAPGLYVVCSGAVKLYHASRFGREHVLDVVFSGAVVGEVGIDTSDRLSVSAEALSESQISFLSNANLAAFLRKHPEAAMRMLVALSRALSRTQRKVRDLALKDGESRLASLLLQLATRRDDGSLNGARLRYSRRDLADMVGVSTETCIRLLAKIRRKGAIEAAGRELVLRDVERLRQIANYDEQDG